MAGMDTWGEKDSIHRKEAFKQAVFKVNPTQGKHRATDSRREDEVNDGMKSPTPQVDSVTQQNCMSLQDNLERLSNKISNLEERLMPVLREIMPLTSDAEGYSGPTPLSSTLAELCQRSNDLIERIEYLTARLDL